MATLTVKNVGPIREAEVEVKKHTIFIGPQGSGKSTLAKLIAIGGDEESILIDEKPDSYFEEKYNLNNYFNSDSHLLFTGINYSLSYDKKFVSNVHEERLQSDYKNEIREKVFNIFSTLANLEKLVSEKSVGDNKVSDIRTNLLTEAVFLQNSILQQILDGYNSIYVPAERQLITVLSNAIWSIIYSDSNLPKILTLFSKLYEDARDKIPTLYLPFLKISYQYTRESEKILLENKEVNLLHSASGYQSIIPMLIVIEQQRRQSNRRFIIEEPELNLYPTAQKDLIYSLMSGLDPNVEYKGAEWVITTHSPYILSSFNTLMLAYKVAQRSNELRAEVEKLVPARCWINPDEFAAYYVDNGTVRSIINAKTGLIDENELDDVSDTLADEQEALFSLNRAARQPRA